MDAYGVYLLYLAFKKHFTTEKYDFIKYKGKIKASEPAFKKRTDRYFFEKLSRKVDEDQIKEYFLACFIECDNPSVLWIGDIAQNGQDNYNRWKARIDSLSYLFKNELTDLCSEYPIEEWFKVKNGSHPPILRALLKKKVSLETFVIIDKLIGSMDSINNKVFDPAWDAIYLRARKYQSFLNIDLKPYRTILHSFISNHER